MPVIGTLYPSSSWTTAPPTPTPNVDNSLSHALLKGTRQLLMRKLNIYLTVITGLVIFGAAFYAIVSAACRGRRYRAAAITAERQVDTKKSTWDYGVNEKEWIRRREESQRERDEQKGEGEERWRGVEGGGWHEKWQEQVPQQSQCQQQRRWSGFTPNTFVPGIHSAICPHLPFMPIEGSSLPPIAPLLPLPNHPSQHASPPPPHLLAAILPQSTVRPYHPQDPQRSPPKHHNDNAKLTRQWDEKREHVVGAVMVRGGVRRNVRMFGG